MDFETFEQLTLRVIYESRQAVTAVYLAYRTHLPSRLCERYLAHMIENGTLHARANAAGVVEYYVPGVKRGKTAPHGPADENATPEPGALPVDSLAAAASPLTAVCLSVLVPGAGHIYSGRPGAGVAWMASTLMGYACCFFPGVFLHGLCMLSAAHASSRAQL